MLNFSFIAPRNKIDSLALCQLIPCYKTAVHATFIFILNGLTDFKFNIYFNLHDTANLLFANNSLLLWNFSPIIASYTSGICLSYISRTLR